MLEHGVSVWTLVVQTRLRPTWILPSSPVLSILLATFTVLPQMSYWGFLAPMTPAITGPWLIPARREAAAPEFSLQARQAANYSQ